jgi:hypothetical protein
MTEQKKAHITQDELKQMLDYNPETGIFTWKDCRRATYNGKRAGSVNHDKKQGYKRRVIVISNKWHREQNLAWLYVYGETPLLHLDHINNDATDNRIVNLRLATPTENKRNSKIYKNNKSGYKGVTFLKKSNTYRAEIRINGKGKNLGERKCPIEAYELYKKAANEHFGEFANYG